MLGRIARVCCASWLSVHRLAVIGFFPIKRSRNQKLIWPASLGNGARYRFRTCDPYRVKVVLYH